MYLLFHQFQGQLGSRQTETTELGKQLTSLKEQLTTQVTLYS